MASFPSAWIIGAEQPESTPRPQPSPVPTGGTLAPRPPRKWSFPSLRHLQSLELGGYDDVYPIESHGRAYTPGGYDIFPSKLRSHPLSGESWATATRAPTRPQRRSSGRYSTRFPSSWLLPAQNSASSVTSFGRRPATRVGTLRASTPLSSATPLSATSIPKSAFRNELPIRTSIHAGGSHAVTGIRDSFVAEAEASPEAMGMRDHMMSERNGEPTYLNKREDIAVWVRSLDPTTRVSASESILSSIDNRLSSTRGKHPSSFDESDLSDASGLGDVPHITQEVPDTYSIYSTSTCLRDEVV
ncbi:MAG: hypothetical protein M1840_006472 [Geoglossum simile]|nr:MAG: hypothetical protein M1840_006472 [Geoglossum simile]